MQQKKLFSLLAFIGVAATAFSQEVTFTAVDGARWSADAQGIYQNSYEMLFDNTPKKWGATTTVGWGAWFIFKASESVILNGYTLITGEDNETQRGRNPRTWTLYGMNADSTPTKSDLGWNKIDEITDDNNSNTTEDDPGLEDLNNKAYYFDLSSNLVSYNYYKFEVGKSYSATDVQLSEFIPSYDRSVVLTGLGGGHWNNDEKWTNMIDGNLSSKWTCWPWDGRNFIIVDAGAPITLKRYMLSTGNDTYSFQGRNPTAWTIWGTNEKNDNWTTYDDPTEAGNIDWSVDGWEEVVNVSSQTLPITNGTPTVFNVTGSPGAYRYYKFKVTACQGNNMFQLGEIKLYPVCEHTDYTYQISPLGQTTKVCFKCGKTTIDDEAPATIAMADGKASWNLGSERTNKTVTYTRTISSDMGTVCLPYALDVSTKTDATYYTLGKYDDENDVLYFDEVTNTLPARTPAIYVRGESVTSLNLNANSVTLPVSDNSNPSVDAARGSNDWKMIGTVKSGTASESSNSIFYLKGGSFYRCNDHISYKPYRAYITGPEDATPGVKAFGIADDMEDAINSLTETENGEIQLYDLNGRKVNEIRNGEVYIMNGRKVMFNK